jgi:selenoprotein W-related protein
VEYCVSCGFLPRAEETKRAVLSVAGDRIEGVELKPGDGGVFKVSVGDEVIYDKRSEGYDVAVIAERVVQKIERS